MTVPAPAKTRVNGSGERPSPNTTRCTPAANASRAPRTFFFMRPEIITEWMGMAHEQRFWGYLAPMAIVAVLYLMQKMRVPAEAARRESEQVPQAA